MSPRRTTYLVPLDGTSRGDVLLLHAIAAARREAGRVVAVAATHIPPTLPTNDVPLELEAPARHALQTARALAWQYHCPIEVRHVAARDTARAIAREAAATGADALLVPIRRSGPRWLMPLLDRFAWSLIRHAPCPVILDAVRPIGSSLDVPALRRAS